MEKFSEHNYLIYVQQPRNTQVLKLKDIAARGTGAASGLCLRVCDDFPDIRDKAESQASRRSKRALWTFESRFKKMHGSSAG